MALSYTAQRRCLQWAIGMAAIVPLSGGLAGMLLGARMTDYVPAEYCMAWWSLDSHVRYLSGLLFGLGVGFLSLVPTIERRGREMRLLALLVVIGGITRLHAALFIAMPPWPMLFGLMMELVLTPLLCLWQVRVARSARQAVAHGTSAPVSSTPA